VNHIEKNDTEKCVLIERLPDPIVSRRGTGPAICFRGAFLYAREYPQGKPPHEAKVFSVEIEITYYDKEILDRDDPIRRDYTIDVPINLGYKFTKKEFDAWVKELRQKRQKETRNKELAELEKLAKKYPNVIKSLRSN